MNKVSVACQMLHCQRILALLKAQNSLIEFMKLAQNL